MKLFLALALLSGTCVYGMENNSENNERNQLKKSQELLKGHFFYCDYPGGPVTPYDIVLREKSIPQNQNPLSLSGRVPSQLLIGAIIQYQTNK